MNLYNKLSKIQRIFPLICLFGSIAGIIYYGFNTTTIIVSFVFWCLYYGVAGSVCYHRLITHRSYKTSKYVEYFMCFLGVFANLGSPARWSIAHTLHHIHSDTEYDPHPARLTGFFGQYPIITSTQVDIHNIPNVPMKSKKAMVKKYRKILNEPFHQFLDNKYNYILFGWSLFLLVFFGFEGLVFAQLFPVVLMNTSIVITNYFGHTEKYGAYRSFNISDESTNNPFLTLVTFGDVLHNNHHRFPNEWNHSKLPWELDPGAWIIRLIKKKDVA